MDDKTRELYAAIGRGETVQFLAYGSTWMDVLDPRYDGIGAPIRQWRIKPRTRTVSIELPEPMKVAPENGEKYWFADPMRVDECSWEADETDHEWLAAGLCYATREEAEAVVSAIRKALRGE